MIKIFNINSKEIYLKIERFSSNYIFVYLNEEKNKVFYGNDLKELLNSKFLPKKFKVNYKSISILLTTGLIPPPYTVYQNLFKISQGIECKLFAINEEVKISFSEKNKSTLDTKQPPVSPTINVCASGSCCLLISLEVELVID